MVLLQEKRQTLLNVAGVLGLFLGRLKEAHHGITFLVVAFGHQAERIRGKRQRVVWQAPS
jgi:hypothetical protein